MRAELKKRGKTCEAFRAGRKHLTMKRFIVVLMAAIAICFSVTSCGNGSRAFIQAQATATNLKCPQDVGNGLTLVSVEFGGLYLVYSYKGEGMYFSQNNVTPEMKNQIIQALQAQAQSDSSTKKLIEALKKENVGIIYHYFNSSDMVMDVVIEARELDGCQPTTTIEKLSAVAVDLGLPSGCKWAEANLGASSCEEAGYFFFWGDTSPCKKGSRYKYVNDCYYDGGGESQYLKYVTDAENGIVDGKTIMDPQDDAATVMLGDSWTVPTFADVEELLKYCSWKEANRNGIEGVEFVGPNGNTLFFPDFNGSYDPSFDMFLGYTSYWSQSLSSNDNLAYALQIKHTSEGTELELDWAYRTSGGMIRPVKH